jgi:hypothetical protein
MTYVAGFATHLSSGRIRDFELRWNTNYAVVVDDRATAALTHTTSFTVGISEPCGVSQWLNAILPNVDVHGFIDFAGQIKQYSVQAAPQHGLSPHRSATPPSGWLDGSRC